jgi:hypothetical protein
VPLIIGEFPFSALPETGNAMTAVVDWCHAFAGTDEE